MHYYLAASGNHLQIVKDLLKLHPNAALVDKKNQTAYSIGIEKGRILHACIFFKSFFPAIASRSNTSAQLIKKYLESMLFESELIKGKQLLFL